MKFSSFISFSPFISFNPYRTFSSENLKKIFRFFKLAIKINHICFDVFYTVSDIAKAVKAKINTITMVLQKGKNCIFAV
jgi:hypothetical protein